MALSLLPSEPATTSTLPEPLARHLAAATQYDFAATTRYLERGADLVTPCAIEAIGALLPEIERKLDSLRAPSYLRRRIEILACYFIEACADGHGCTPAHREAAFALCYFHQAADRVPDWIPDAGLADDATIVQLVLQRQLTTLRAHWLRRRRAWPAEF